MKHGQCTAPARAVPAGLLLSLVPALVLAVPALSAEPDAGPPSRRWVYMQTNLQVAENVDRAVDVMRRAKAAGYNGVVLADYKLQILDRVPEFYFDHARRFKKSADELGIEVIPTVCPIGYSDGLLAHDPNLAEGIPVEGAAFVARNGTARLASEGKNLLPGGGFEEHRGHLTAGWDFQDAAGKASFVDTEIKHGGASSLRWDDPGRGAEGSGGNARVSKQVAVSPWRQYHASVWIKTDSYESAGSVRLFGMGADGRVLSHSNLSVKPTQDWTLHHVVFNSLENEAVRVYCGTWGGRGGTLWMDDLRLEETAFVNLLRRDGCPLIVRDAAGTVYEEGRDYEPLRDPKSGHVPWQGGFEAWHEPPRLTLSANSRIKDGQELRVSFSHTVTIYDNQVTCCLGHPKVFEIVADQVRRVNELFEPETFFLSHDEIRVANWCGSCRQEGRTAGELLAENVRRCVAAIREVSPKARLCVWSDMFDPHHNAHDDFYLVNGDLSGSWHGLPEDMTIVNWNSGAPAKSLPFFAGRGHSQVLAGYYDGRPAAIADWLKAAEEVRGVDGVMYTTWQNNFRDLEAFAEAAWGSAAKETPNAK
jgi:hypothetical protein